MHKKWEGGNLQYIAKVKIYVQLSVHVYMLKSVLCIVTCAQGIDTKVHAHIKHAVYFKDIFIAVFQSSHSACVL